MNEIKKATERLIDSVWTLTYKQVSEDEIEIIAFNRNDAEGYKNERQLDRMCMIEAEGRIVTEVRIGSNDGFKSWADGSDKLFKVINPKFVFSYE